MKQETVDQRMTIKHPNASQLFLIFNLTGFELNVMQNEFTTA
jgi:hypothetical protein